MYMIEKWALAKAEALEVGKNVLAARQAATDRIKQGCGQSLPSAYSHPWDPTYRGVDYSILYKWKAEDHWDISLRELHARVELLKPFTRPEAWEAAWAASQE